MIVDRRDLASLRHHRNRHMDGHLVATPGGYLSLGTCHRTKLCGYNIAGENTLDTFDEWWLDKGTLRRTKVDHSQLGPTRGWWLMTYSSYLRSKASFSQGTTAFECHQTKETHTTSIQRIIRKEVKGWSRIKTLAWVPDVRVGIRVEYLWFKSRKGHDAISSSRMLTWSQRW